MPEFSFCPGKVLFAFRVGTQYTIDGLCLSVLRPISFYDMGDGENARINMEFILPFTYGNCW